MKQTINAPDILHQHALALPSEDHAPFWRAVDDVAGLGWPTERVLAKAIEAVERARKLRRPKRETYSDARRQIQLTDDVALRKLLNATPKSVLADVVLLLMQQRFPEKILAAVNAVAAKRHNQVLRREIHDLIKQVDRVATEAKP